ncbi:MAG: xanthine dehydrogenase family protein molybdopterin-binding subunit [Gammaproteobacteria bacterium]|nr:xanthine dehydrogenase family protein molybdopterin-binding subunit [Gammaproteobacteria bacterium]
MKVSASLKDSPLLDQWLALDTDGRITVRTGKVEIGQRIGTALTRIVAHELHVDPARIHIVPADTRQSPDEGYTSGSHSMEHAGGALTLAGATARAHLLGLAAERLGCDPKVLQIDDGLIRAPSLNQSVSYWELLQGRPFDIPVDLQASPRPTAESGLFGQRLEPLGIRDLVSGRSCFVHDLRFDGMLHARVVRPPHYHARLQSLDDDVVTGLGDARVVRDGSFVAVVASDEFVAMRAAERVATRARWQHVKDIDTTDIRTQLLDHPRTSLPVVDGTPHREPVPPLGPTPAHASLTLSANYHRPYQMHGSIGPSAACALYSPSATGPGELLLWSHTQGIFPLQQSLAELLGMDAERIEVRHVPGSGCYGHNGADDAAVDAALVARAVPGRHILLKWTRADEHAWEPYAPAMSMSLRASLDDRGNVIDWSHESYSDTHRARPRPGPNGVGPARLLAGQHLEDPAPAYVPVPNMARHAGIHRNADPLYAFANRRIVKHLVHDLPLRTSAMRTLGGFANVFAIECFMDELAHASGQDPLRFRLAHLHDDRARAVLQRAADEIGWTDPGPPGEGLGIAVAQYTNSQCYSAVAVRARIGDDARLRLLEVVVSGDAGRVVDADGVEAQLEGGFIQAASWTLFEQVRFAHDGISSRDWESYPILRFEDMPRLRVALIDRPEAPSLGVGEASCGPAGAAIANALFAASGLRVRELPLTPERLRAQAMRD